MRSLSSFLFVLLFMIPSCAKSTGATVGRINRIDSFEEAIEAYQKIAKKGGWPLIPAGPKLTKGDVGEKVVLLRKRLGMTGVTEKEALFNEELGEAVRHFQERHGLEPDGVAGKETVAAMNVPVEARLRQLELNRKRYQEFSEKVKAGGKRAIIVNIPDFRLKIFEDGRPIAEMKVIVGQNDKDWKTPLLSSHITTLILNPTWSVPPTIFEKEVILELRKDPTYLAQNNMMVVRTADKKQEPVDPAKIDWNRVDEKTPEFRIVQREGEGNSLGRIKFLFPNKYAVYLHDTPHKALFSKPVRALSHGCVRVEKPMELAQFLMKDHPRWTQDKLEKMIEDKQTRYLLLPSPVDIHIIYLTAWVDHEGRVQFRNDIYQMDLPATPLTPSQ